MGDVFSDGYPIENVHTHVRLPIGDARASGADPIVYAPCIRAISVPDSFRIRATGDIFFGGYAVHKASVHVERLEMWRVVLRL